MEEENTTITEINTSKQDIGRLIEHLSRSCKSPRYKKEEDQTKKRKSKKKTLNVSSVAPNKPIDRSNASTEERTGNQSTLDTWVCTTQTIGCHTRYDTQRGLQPVCGGLQRVGHIWCATRHRKGHGT